MKKLKLKKNTIIFGVGFIVVLLGIILLASVVQKNSTDGAKFKKEYESLNGEKAYGDYKYQDLDIPKKNKVKYATLEEAINIIKMDTGLIYFGFPNCPWCRGMIPTLIDTVECSCLEEMYYVDMTDLRNTYEVVDGEVEETVKATDEYKELLELLDAYLLDYTVTDEDGVEYDTRTKRVYVPMLVAVRNGEIVGAQVDTVTLDEGQSAFDELTQTQKSELSIKIGNLIELITEEESTDEYVCEEHC